MSLFGVGLDFSIKKIQNSIKDILRKKTDGINELYESFHYQDQEGLGSLSPSDFERALQGCKLYLGRNELQAIIKCYDAEGSGRINWMDFAKALTDHLSERRSRYVNKIYSFLERAFAGGDDEKFLEGLRDKHKAIFPYLNAPSRENFFFYNEAKSLSYVADIDFVKYLFNTWGVPEDEDSDSNDDIRGIVREIRQKVTQMTKGSKEEYFLRKLFWEYDVEKSGVITPDAFQVVMASINIGVDRKYINGIFKKFDASRKGSIPYENFLYYIFHDPYLT